MINQFQLKLLFFIYQLEYEKVLKKNINEKENEILSLGTQIKHKDETINKFKITNDEIDADMIRLKRDFNNLQESKDNMFNDLVSKTYSQIFVYSFSFGYHCHLITSIDNRLTEKFLF